MKPMHIDDFDFPLPPELIAALKDRVVKGVTTFIVFFSDGTPPQTLETFAKEVMPAFA